MKKGRIGMAGILLLTGLMLTACAGGAEKVATQAPVTSQVKGGPTTSAKPAWEADWELTLAEAKKEGVVTIYTGYGSEFRAVLSKAMKEKYGIEAEFVSGRSAEIAERVMREQTSKTYVADVINVGTGQFQLTFWNAKVPQPLQPIIVLPEVLDPKVWWAGRVPWVDRDQTLFQMFAYPNTPMVINTDLVRSEEINSYRDLLNPRWKGRIVIDDPTISGAGQQLFAVLGFALTGFDYLRDLAKQEPLLVRDRHLQGEWLAKGKYPVMIGGATEQFIQLKQAGAPLKFVAPVEGVHLTQGFGCVAVARGAPHPNAAKVFVNFLLTREGQTLASRAVGLQSARVDVPTDQLFPEQVRSPGVKYFSTTDEGFMREEFDLYKQVIDIFRGLVK